MNSALAADLGGTKARFARVTADYRVLDDRRVPTGADEREFLENMCAELEAIAAIDHAGVEPPSAVGIGVAGLVRDSRVLISGTNLPFAPNAELAAIVEARLGVATRVLNDGRASALGEYCCGDAAGCDPLLALFFGTGIGIGFISGGQLYRGATDAAGEVGHTPWRRGRTCSCGRDGCFEAYCGGGPMCRRATAECGAPPAGFERWTVGAIVAAADDARCRAILDDAREAATALVSTLCTLLNPAAIVLGGGALSGWPALRDDLERGAREWCSAEVSSVRFADSVGSDAILRGAAVYTGVFDAEATR